jgi:hypothetical protein
MSWPMKYYLLEPESPGGFGPDSVFFDVKARPPRIAKFNYEFDIWPRDPLIEAVACYIVTELLREKIEALHPTGVSFGLVEISKSGQFEDLYPNFALPKFVWLQVSGKAGQDDFGLSTTHSLVVSERVLSLLKEAGMSHCDVAEFDAVERL